MGCTTKRGLLLQILGLLILLVPGAQGQSALQWNGNLSANWDTATANWLVGANSVKFTNGAAVWFTDAAAGTTVSLTQTLQPASVTVSNQSKVYTFAGPGELNGSGGLTKQGAAKLVFSPGVRLNSSGAFTIGGGSVIMEGTASQAHLNTGELWVGNTTASAASLVLSNTVVTNTSWVAIGRGNGTTGLASSLTLHDSTLSAGNVSLGYAAGIQGNFQYPSLNLEGSSRLINSGGNGFLIGESSGSSATVTISDNSRIYSGSRVQLGMQTGATGALVIANSGTLTNGGYVSVGAPGAGSVLLKDNAVWQALVDFNITDTAGSADSPSVGTVTIQDNALLRINTLYLGKNNYCTGTLNQNGGTVMRNSGGDWRIGGNVAAGTAQFGYYNLSNGTVNAGSANLQIGAYGNGQFNQSGGTVYAGSWPAVGRYPGSVGELNVSGGSFNHTGSSTALIIAEEGTGTLNLSQTGLVSTVNTLSIGHASGGNGTVNLNGGTLAAKRVIRNSTSATGILNFNGGTLLAQPGAESAFLGGLTATYVKSGGAIIDSGTNRVTISQDLLYGGGNAGLAKRGTGKLTLGGALQYTGATVVEAGTLVFTAPKTPASGSVSAAGGAGFGVHVLSTGSRVIVTNLTMTGGANAALEFNYGGLGNQSVAALFVPGTLNLSGPVNINITGVTFQVGQFPLVQYNTRTGTGGFQLGALPSGMTATLVTNTLAKTIELNVTTAPSGLPWELKQAPIMTDWAQQVDPENPWPEYPRPQMQRTNWMHLNGVWQWQAGNATDPVPTGNLSGSILVPFCMESAISGVMEHHDRAWYQRTFTVPTAWSGQRLLLHFEAVDWESEIFINGVSVGVHRGGYDPFSFDVTPYLTGSGPQTLLVRVFDPTDANSGPVVVPNGKQRLSPGGIWYTPCSGIWQSVWLEPVPTTSIADIQLVPDVDVNQLRVKVTVTGPTNGVSIQAAAFDGPTQVATATGVPGAQFSLSIPTPKLWSPSNPFLYDLRLTLTSGAGSIDTVVSYFGMRKISLGTQNGFVKMFLNNEFLFQFGPLDQGFWPDGIYTPPTDLAMREDIEQTKALGFNFIRKHVKVEPRRWYYYTDKLGLVVWQDMPSMAQSPASPSASATNFETEMARMIRTHWNSPSIIVWTVFNEGWGQYDTVRVTTDVMNLDPSRLVNCASGWTFYQAGHIEDSHSYPNPSCPQNDSFAVVNGEFGGVGLGITNHTWAEGWGYVGAVDGEDLTARFENFCFQLNGYIENNGLSAAVYTQITDVETELNGLYTYDRKVFKPLLRRMQNAIASTYGVYDVTPVVPTSEAAAQSWSYTTTTPAANWYTTGFSAAGWSTGNGGFGTAGTPGAVVGTTWNTADIWLRRSFDGTGLTSQQISNLVLRVHHDEAVEIYINGVAAASASGYTTAYGALPLSEAAKSAIVAGPGNILAVHCHQTGGGQFIDAGLDLRTVVIPPPPPPPIPNWPENGTGVLGEYFAGTNLANPVLVRNDAQINFNWGEGSPGANVPANQFSVRWSAHVQPRYSEVYTFHVTANDGCRLWVNGELLINKWREDAGTDTTGSILLTGGERYDLRLEYFDSSGSASVVLEWNSASQPREVVSQGVLFPNHAPSLAAVADRVVVAGQRLSITNQATDPDAGQSLAFSLLSGPSGAVVNASSGIFDWRPAVAQSPSVNAVSIVVTDDGAPALSATQTFNVTVARPTAPTVVSPAVISGGAFQMMVSGDLGPDYLVYATTNLAQPSWTLVLSTNPASLPFTFTDPEAGNFSQRYYRILLGP